MKEARLSRGLQAKLVFLVALALAALTALAACSDDTTYYFSNLRSPSRVVMTSRCVEDGIWRTPEECADPDAMEHWGYVTNEGGASLSYVEVIGRSAELIDQRFSVPGISAVPIGERPRALVATPDGAFVISANSLSQDVSVVEVARAREIASFDTPATVVDMVLDDTTGQVWLAYVDGVVEARALTFDCGEGQGVYKEGCELSAADIGFEVLGAVALDASPRSLELDPLRRRLYVAFGDSLHISALSIEGNEEPCLVDGDEGYSCEVVRLPGGYGCSNGIDDDGDGFIDGQDPQCFSRSGAESPEGTGRFAKSACNDGLDNDGDQLADAFDPDCEGSNDNSEGPDFVALVPGECTDGIDNDGDGLVDNRDGGCRTPDDLKEGGETLVPECSNGIDDDDDGLIDFPEDPECESATDAREDDTPGCNDGIDNDGDGFIDLDDDGCLAWDDVDEGVLETPCNDGIDNDGDGLIDVVDPGCYGHNGRTEAEVERTGLGPMAIDPLGRWLYILDKSEWQVLIVDLETSTLLDAGARDPYSDVAGVRVSPLPLAVEADIRTDILYDEGRVRVERQDALFYVATSSGILEVGTVAQTFLRYVDDSLAEAYTIPLLRLQDSESEEALYYGQNCVNMYCSTDEIPVPRLRQRHIVSVSDNGDLIVEEGGKPLSAAADPIFISEEWSMAFEGVLPGSERSDGLMDPVYAGLLSARVNFCSLGVYPGDWLTINTSPVDDEACAGLREPTESGNNPKLRWRVRHVRSDQIYLEVINDSSSAQVLPTRECFPYALEFEVRAPGQWLVQGSSTSFLGRETRGGVCMSLPTETGKARFSPDTDYENAFFAITIPGDLSAQQDVGVQFGISDGFTAMRRSLGPIPGDIVVNEADDEKLIFVPDAGANQVYIFDAEDLTSLEPL